MSEYEVEELTQEVDAGGALSADVVEAFVDVVLAAVAPIADGTTTGEVRFAFFANALVLAGVRIAVLAVFTAFATQLGWTLTLEIVVAAVEHIRAERSERAGVRGAGIRVDFTVSALEAGLNADAGIV